jgi:hypothetical protein
MPEGYDVWVKSARDCEIIITGGCVEHISFDHDLGHEIFTGYSVACIIESMAYSNKIHRISWDIHSMNPVGREAITKAMLNADRHWAYWELMK